MSASLHSRLSRRQWFEFQECSWFPATFRDAITEILSARDERLLVHKTILPLFEQFLCDTGFTAIVDVCSGAGGPIVPLQRELASRGHVVSVTLSDKYPNVNAFRAAESASAGWVRGYPGPVDATDLPLELSGVRTLFNSFHQFAPGAARGILAHAYHARQPMAIFETTQRSLWNAISSFPRSFVSMLTLLPRLSRKRPEWWVFTYLVPVLPAVLGWDSLVSCLRSYTASEFASLIQGMENGKYSWSGGRLAVPGASLCVTYFLGVPKV